jgi:uncharacterized phiE125 gp8 family phage protein
MNITTIVAPRVLPVTMQEAYDQLRLDPEGSPPEHANDALILANLREAVGQAEKDSHRAFVQQTVRLSTAAFGCIQLLRPPLIRVNSVKYFDGDNALQTVDPADYYVTDDVVPELRFLSGYGSPTVYARPDALRVEYVVGYAPTDSPEDDAALRANVPAEIKGAIRLGLQLLYEALSPSDRESLERARRGLLYPYTIPVLE